MAVKTRERLIEVARKLFLYKGVDQTTMLDIANASDKGRRTLYTYFRSKTEIYDAVVERESERYVASLRTIVNESIDVSNRLERFLEALLQTGSAMTATQMRDSFMGWLNLDFDRANKIRMAVLDKEVELLAKLLDEGIDGHFDRDQCLRFIEIFPALAKAAPYFDRDNDSGALEKLIPFIVHSLRNNPSSTEISKTE